MRFSWIALFFLAVAHGFSQPSLSLAASALSGSITLGLALYLLCREPSCKRALSGAFLWYFLSQLIQFYWMVSHPYVYIYFVWCFVSALYTLPFVILCYYLYRCEARVLTILSLSAIWTLIEWSRLYILSGVSWNPVGLSLSGFDSARQLASWGGVYGLSFWVVLTNLFFFSFLQRRGGRVFVVWAVLAAAPFVLGEQILASRMLEKKSLESDVFHVALIQTGFPANGGMKLSFHEMVQMAFEQWERIIALTSSLEKEEIELVVLPEFAIPFPRSIYLYPFESVQILFSRNYSSSALPLPREGEGKKFETDDGAHLFVTNGYIARAISHQLGVPVICGMHEMVDEHEQRADYSSAFYLDDQSNDVSRYDKRVLVPMGEYIPFSFLRRLASNYGVGGSFTPGKDVQIIPHPKACLGMCICYEETFGHLMRENKQKGADILVNLTSDVWYPDSMLPWQHFDHARLRTVEMGMPLVRACNTSVTTSVDSLGRVERLLGNGITDQFTPGVLITDTSLYAFETFYSRWGDYPVIAFSLFLALLPIFSRWRRLNSNK